MENNNLLRVNLHTHTHRCNHAARDERRYVERAIENGIKVLGFADHSPQPYPGEYVSHMRMRMSGIEEYVSTVNELKREYKGQIEILLGFEVEYYPLCFENLCSALVGVDYDYFILAQHFTKNEYDGKYVGVSCNSETLVDYVDAICRGLDYDCFTYVAHPDLPRFKGDGEFYEGQMRRICQKAKEKNVPLEINLLGLGEKRFYPRAQFWKIAAEVGNIAVCGVDAHTPENFDCGDTYRRAVKFAGEMGVELTEDVILKSPKGQKRLPDFSRLL